MKIIQMKTTILAIVIPLLFHVSRTGASSLRPSSLEEHGSSLRQRSHSTLSLLEDHSLSERRLDSSDSQDDNGDDNVDDDSGETNIIWKTLNRIDEDMNNMWASSPSEWTTEDWEVFGGMFLVAFLCLSCLCFLCCAPICLFEDRSQRKTLTAEQHVTNQQQKANGAASTLEDGHLAEENEKDNNDVKTTVSSLSAPSYQPGVEKRRSLKEPMLTTVPSTAEKSIRSQASRNSRRSVQKQRRSLWSEAVSVWGEFLSDLSQGKDTFSKTDYKEEGDNDYKKFELERKQYVVSSPQDKRSRKSGRSVSSKRVSSKRVSSKRSGELV